MYHPKQEVNIWYTDSYGREVSHITTWKDFKSTAIILLEKYLDYNVTMYYTVNNETFQLDYYNTLL